MIQFWLTAKGILVMYGELLRYTWNADELLSQKFRYIAEAEGRSANKELERYIKKHLATYEKRYRIIPISPNRSLF